MDLAQHWGSGSQGMYNRVRVKYPRGIVACIETENDSKDCTANPKQGTNQDKGSVKFASQFTEG